ncbi:hypothetical protein G9P44_002373 [Scheffersomyces stipitis]|nr:hypothetical protein G9P44_002373 [Scheffersomyces stipitis]
MKFHTLVLIAASISVALAEVTSLGQCHFHGLSQFCIDNEGEEGTISPAPTNTENAPLSYTGCHSHGSDIYCLHGSSEVKYTRNEGEDDHDQEENHDHSDEYSGQFINTEEYLGNHDHEHSDDHSHSEEVISAVTSTTESTLTPEHRDDHDHPSETVARNTDSAPLITACHFHDDDLYCKDKDGSEGYVIPAPTDKSNFPSSYTSCHNHASETFCMNAQNEVQFLKEAPNTPINTESATASTSQDDSLITGCHFHGDTFFCVNMNGIEGSIIPPPSDTNNAPASLTGCHLSETDTLCLDQNGDEVMFLLESEADTHQSSSAGRKCHFHAGVEHCDGGSEAEVEPTCERYDRDYNIPLRIGLLFAILVSSIIAAFGPLFLKNLFKLSLEGYIATVIKQFGTGVIISTAFVHLLTHAALMWGNSCIKLKYEATGNAISMAGIFLAFLVEFIASRVLRGRSKMIESSTRVQKGNDDEKNSATSSDEIRPQPVVGYDHCHGVSPQDKFSVYIMEAGIIFHSVLIGVTLVVAGDSYFITLFIVILFHQVFEGLALGARIAEIDNANIVTKMIMAGLFAVITPVGMAIGIGVLNKFNGNDPSTIIALGTLDSFSAGVLIWTGILEMWAHDWIFGHLARAPLLKTGVALISLVAGMILMSFLGKWA